MGRNEFKIPEIIFDPTLALSPHVCLLGMLFHIKGFKSITTTGPVLDSPEKLYSLGVLDGLGQQELKLKDELLDKYVFCQTIRETTGFRTAVEKNSSANTLTSCRGRTGLQSSSYHLSPVSSPSNSNPAVQSTPLEGRSFPLGPERLVAPEDLSVRSGHSPTAPLVDDTGDGTETPYHSFNEHFSHHNGGGDTGTSQPDGDVADKCYSPLYGENQTFSWSFGGTRASDDPP